MLLKQSFLSTLALQLTSRRSAYRHHHHHQHHQLLLVAQKFSPPLALPVLAEGAGVRRFAALKQGIYLRTEIIFCCLHSVAFWNWYQCCCFFWSFLFVLLLILFTLHALLNVRHFLFVCSFLLSLLTFSSLGKRTIIIAFFFSFGGHDQDFYCNYHLFVSSLLVFLWSLSLWLLSMTLLLLLLLYYRASNLSRRGRVSLNERNGNEPFTAGRNHFLFNLIQLTVAISRAVYSQVPNLSQFY